jgi:hypothetical protein
MPTVATAGCSSMCVHGSASAVQTLSAGARAIDTSVRAPLARRTASYWRHAGGAPRALSRPEAQQRSSAHASCAPWSQGTSHAVGTVRSHVGTSVTAAVAAVSAHRRLWQWVSRWARLWADARVAKGARRRYQKRGMLAAAACAGVTRSSSLGSVGNVALSMPEGARPE